MKIVRAFCADPEVLARADKMAEILGISFSSYAQNVALNENEMNIINLPY